jgi:hypothetical protein
MPCLYCSFVDAPPTLGKWPFTVIIEGVVGYLEAPDGRLSWPFDR